MMNNLFYDAGFFKNVFLMNILYQIVRCIFLIIFFADKKLFKSVYVPRPRRGKVEPCFKISGMNFQFHIFKDLFKSLLFHCSCPKHGHIIGFIEKDYFSERFV